MITSFTRRCRSLGFTMIELLVVIAVIGVLAVAVLSSINPIEQINKGRDTRTRSDAAQLINAVDRYFSIHEVYPWNAVSATFDPVAAGVSTDYVDEFAFDERTLNPIAGAITDWNWLDVLTETAEVKEGFVSRLKTDTRVEYLIYKSDSSNATMYICFAPSSNAFQQEAQTRCTSEGVGADVEAYACPATCTDSSDVSTCLTCLP